MLEKEYQYFKENQDDIIEKYPNKFIVIKDENIIGIYASQKEALTETLRKHKLGTFLLQFVSPDKNDYTQKFHSRVMFVNAN